MSRSVAVFTFVLLSLATVAFWPMYLSKPWTAIDRHTHLHALFGTLWLLALVAQPLMMWRGHRRAHRVAGRVSMFVATGFVVSGVLLTHYKLNQLTAEAFAREGIFIYLPLSIATAFAGACALGYLWRGSPSLHVRFMVSTAILLVDPVLARLMFYYLPPLPSEHIFQGVTFSLIAVALVALLRSLPAASEGREAYRAYVIATLSLLALFFVIPYTAFWRHFVLWFRALPLT